MSSINPARVPSVSAFYLSHFKKTKATRLREVMFKNKNKTLQRSISSLISVSIPEAHAPSMTSVGND